MHRIFIILILLLMSCSPNPKSIKMMQAVEEKADSFQAQSRPRTVDVVEESYLGATSIPMGPMSHPILNKHVTLRTKGSLPAIASEISSLLGIPVQVATDSGAPVVTAPGKAPKHPAQPHPDAAPPADGINMDLEALLQVPSVGVSSATSGGLSISYEGTVRGLLDHVAMLSGYGWDHDQNEGILFAKMLVRTFSIIGAPGKVTYENQLTNKSKDSSGSRGIGSTAQTVSIADTSSQNAQSNTVSWEFDIWSDTESAIKALLSPQGTVVSNPAAGTITVRDAPDIIRRVTTYVDDVNTRLSRQIALKIQVWSLSVNDNSDIGVSVSSMFADGNIQFTGNVASGDLNSVTASIVSGTLKDSSAILKALRQWGNATQVTSAGGICMSNQPVPAMAIERTAYLAGMGMSQSEFGQTTEVTPGEVTTGFSMTVIPHILDQRRVVLHYNINLSALDEMKEFTTSDITVQLPQVSTRAFSQRTTMKMGQTLVLTGFEKEMRDIQKSVGILNTFRKTNTDRTVLIITIAVESAEV